MKPGVKYAIYALIAGAAIYAGMKAYKLWKAKKDAAAAAPAQ